MYAKYDKLNHFQSKLSWVCLSWIRMMVDAIMDFFSLYHNTQGLFTSHLAGCLPGKTVVLKSHEV